MSGTHPSRRRFLTKGAAAAGLVASAPALELAGGSAAAAAQAPVVADNNAIESVLYGQRSRFVTTTREIEGRSHSQTPRIRPNPQRPSARTPLAELTGTITPTSLHFTTQHYYGIPDINPAEHTLMVEGMVDRPLVFTMDELRRMPFVSRVHFLECVGNRPNPRGATVTATHGRMACSEWTGVPLSVLLDEVGVRDGASWIIAEATDGGRHNQERPPRQGPRRRARRLRAERRAGAARPRLPATAPRAGVRRHLQREVAQAHQGGRPALPVVPGAVALPDPGPEDAAGQLRLRAQLGHHPAVGRPASCPRTALCVISGLAWSGSGKVTRVEVSTDGGATYQEADLVGPVLSKAHTRFCLPWRWNGDEAVLQSRCLDERDQLQPTEAEYAHYWGLTRGQLYGTIQSQLGHCNWIQPWKVGSDGEVTNGLEPTDVVVDVHA